MEQSKQVKLARNRTANVQFYARSPFRNFFFIIVTGAFALALLCWTFVVVEGWRHLTFQVSIYLTLVIFFLVAIYRLGLQVHERIHLLIEAGRIEEIEEGSPLEMVLGATKDMILSGLFMSLAVVVFCLVSLGEVLLNH